MPVVDIPMDDPAEPDRTVAAWAWAEEIHIYPARERVVLKARVWNSAAAAYNPGSTSKTRDLVVQGPAYRALVIANPAVFASIAGLADPVLRDGLAHPTLGPGTVVPATVPAWALPPEPDPEPEPE